MEHYLGKILLIILLFDWRSEAKSCRDGWMRTGKICVRKNRDPKTWREAQKHCFSEDGWLLGSEDIQSFRKWNTEERIHVGSPDIRASSADNNFCLEWDSRSDVVQGVNCEAVLNPFVCASELRNESSGRQIKSPYLTSCEEGWVEVHTHCYFFPTDKVPNFEDGYKKCSDLGGVLAVIPSQFANNEVKKNLKGSTYIGLEKSPSENVFYWSDGAVLSGRDFTSWDEGYPKPNDTLLRVEMSQNGNWRNVDHLGERHYACSKTKINCPKGFILFKESCYLFSKEKKSFLEAETYCGALSEEGAFLANVRSQAVNDFIGKQLRGTNAFIGLRYDEVNRVHFWADGYQYESDTDYHNWDDSSPVPINGQCTVFNGQKTWSSAKCEEPTNFVCEVSPHMSASQNCNFGDNLRWMENSANGDCILVVNRPMTWSEANENCHKFSHPGTEANLLSIHSPSEQIQTVDVFVHHGRRGTYMIGLFLEAQYLRWSDTTILSYTNLGGHNFFKGDCFKMELRSSAGVWSTESSESNNRLPSLCAKKGKHFIEPPPIPDANDCPQGWLRTGEQCLLFSDNAANYQSAKKDCATKESTLAYILDSKTDDFIHQEAMQSNNGQSEHYFGLNDIETEALYVWPDGSKLGDYTNWNGYEPNDNDHTQNCIEMVGNGAWNDLQCDKERKYVCSQRYYVCKNGWHSMNNRCFFASKDKLTFEKALKECSNNHAQLTSIHSEHENNFLLSLMKDSNEPFWIGLQKQAYEAEFKEWVDDTALDYTHFATRGNKADGYGAHLSSDGFWRASDFNTSSNYFCSVKSTHYMSCPRGYKPSPSSCYHLSKTHKTFEGASKACQRKGGYLARIQDEAEMSYITSELFDSESDNVWIGLKGVTAGSGIYFRWEDGSEMTFSLWDELFPESSYDCVWMKERSPTRNWENVGCTRTAHYLCETPQKLSKHPPPSEGGCTLEQIPYLGSCYELFFSKLNFQNVINKCAEKSAEVLKIKNTETQARLISVIHETNANFFLGLKFNTSSSAWTWVDGSSLESYSNWGEDEPNMNSEEDLCAVMISRPPYTGVWKTIPCSQENEYICRSQRKGHTDLPEPTTPTTTLNPTYKCPDNYVQLGSKCYFHSQETVKNFDDAQKECVLMGGYLVAFDTKELEEEILKKVSYDPIKKVYIGLREFPQYGGYHWMNPAFTYGSYVNWAEDEPQSHDGFQTCVYIHSRKWYMGNCHMELSYICEVPSGPGPFPTLPPAPTTTPTLKCHENVEDDGWFMISDLVDQYCYKLSTHPETWHTALRQCRDEQSELASIHSNKENSLLRNIVAKEFPHDWFRWVGINKLNGDGIYEWTDASPVNFVHWKKSDTDLGIESCGQMMILEDGIWAKAHCGLKRAFLCKKPKYGSFPSPTPPPVLKGHCKEGVPEYEGFCYEVVAEEAKTWKDALDFCKTSKSNLISIHSEREMSFLVSRILPTLGTPETWIGLQDAIEEGNYVWNDETDMNYANWAGNEPVPGFGSNSDCVAAYTKNVHKQGKWGDFDCNLSQNFICKSKAVESITNMTYKLPPCETNNEFLAWNDECFLYVEEEKTWSEAVNYCKAKNAHMVSVRTLKENSFILAYSQNQSFWIGLHYSKEHKTMIWDDGSEYIYEKFGVGQQIDPGRDNCVALDSLTGEWIILRECTSNIRKPFWCGIQKSATVDPNMVGKCPDTKHWVKGPAEHCYYFGNKTGLMYDGAITLCEKVGGHLAGIHTRADNEWLRHHARPVHVGHWIGVERASLGTGEPSLDNFYWMDGVAYKGGFTSWVQGYRNKEGTKGEFIPVVGKWSLEEFNKVRDYYICSTEMTYTTMPPVIPTHPSPQSSSGLSSGGVAGIVIGTLCLVGIAFAVVYMKKKDSLPPLNLPNIPNPFQRAPFGRSFANENYEI